MRAKYSLISTAGILISLFVLFVVQPLSPGGQGLLAALVFGMIGTADGQKLPAEDAPGGAIQAQIDAFTRSIVEHDVDAFAAIVSSEVLKRTAERGIGPSAFMEKQRTAILRTFRLTDGERPAFEVAEALLQGNVVRVILRFRGKELEKPLYFVREDGSLKLNFGLPGFSKAAPAGALFSSDKYTVQNDNIPGNQPFAISCYQGSNRTDATITVPASSTGYVSCENACGWFSGSIFRAAGVFDAPERKCDWNWWGADVYINQLDQGGWRCNDAC
jgi:hypothetical protein